MITNKGKHPITDNTPYNHYSLLRSYEDAFGLSCLANACDAATGVKPMTPLSTPRHNATQPKLIMLRL